MVAIPAVVLAWACNQPDANTAAGPIVPVTVTGTGTATTQLAPDPTPAAPAGGLTIAAVGDWYDDDPAGGAFVTDAELTRDAIIALEPDVVLGLGDFSYDNSDPQPFFDFLAPLQAVSPIYPAFGNHDGINAGEIRRPGFYRRMVEHFGLGPFFSRDLGPIRFISINSEYPATFDGHEEQLRLVEMALEEGLADPAISLMVPFFHRSMVNPVTEQGPSPVLQEVYYPLLERHAGKIPIALQAHHHIYTRTHPVRQLPGRDDATCREEAAQRVCQADYHVVDPGEGAEPVVYREPGGIVFATVGTGGAAAQGLTPDTEYMAIRHRPVSAMEDDRGGSFGFLLLIVAPDGSSIEGQFRANSGDVLDWFRIVLD